GGAFWFPPPAARHVVGSGLEYARSGQRIASPPPQPHRACIAGAGSHALAQRRREQQGVAIGPRGATLGFRQGETSSDKVARREVEFAQRHRIGAATPQLHYGAVVATRDRRCPAPRPVLALLCRQRVEVEQDVPFGLLAAVIVERRRPPQATRM